MFTTDVFTKQPTGWGSDTHLSFDWWMCSLSHGHS